MPSQVSGEMPLLPLTRLLSAWRETWSSFAASVTDRPSGSRQSSRTDCPGCGGFFIGIGFCASLVVIDQIDIGDVAAIEAEDDSPIGPYRDTPEAGELTLQGMQ